jgi:general secretion pathway protein N
MEMAKRREMAKWHGIARWHSVIGLALLTGAMLAASPVLQPLTAASASSDRLSDDADGKASDRADGNSVSPPAVTKPLSTANPLWSVPLSVLTSTRERPIFSASRRPPQRVVAAPHIDRVATAPRPPSEPERPPLKLIGAVVGVSDAIAIFIDQTDQNIIRLHQGQTHLGWVLTAVRGRDVTLYKADQTEVLAFAGPDDAASVAKAPDNKAPDNKAPSNKAPSNKAANNKAPNEAPLPGSRPKGSVGVSYAPFVPRSTPQNGEPDGL